MKLRITIACSLLAALAVASAAQTKHGATPAKKSATPAKKSAAAPVAGGPTKVTGEPVVNPSGLKYWDIKVGTGSKAIAGMNVKVHYTGWLANGKKFDSSVDRKEPFQFALGRGQVIKGWEEGVTGMRAGGKRQLRIPPDLAYGAKGFGTVIPPGATLIFDIELLAVN